MKIPDSARAVIESGALVHMATIGNDGRPHVTCAWAGLEDDEIVIATLFDQRKLRQIRRDPRVTLSFATMNKNPYGLTEYLVIYGTGRVTEGGAAELLQRLAHVYIGPDVRFPAMDDPPPGFVTRVTADRIAGVGPWTSGN